MYRDHGVIPKSSRDDNFNKPSDDLSTYRYVEPGDLVLNKMKTWQGSLAVSRFAGIVSPAYYVCSLTAEVEPRFIHYLLRSAPYIAMYGARSKGIRPNQWDLPYDEFKTVPILLPPLDVQRRIADFLDDQVTRLELAIALREQQSLILDRAEAEAFAAVAGRRGLILPTDLDGQWTHLPTGWVVRRLGHVLREFTNGFVGPTRDILRDEGIPYIQSVHIKGGSIEFARKPFFVSREWHQARPRIHLGEGDVLIVQTGDIGQVAVVPRGFGEASCHALQIARADRRLLSGEYLGAYMRSTFAREWMLSRATGALHPHLEASVKGLPVPVPPIHQQKELVEEVRQAQQRTQSLQSAGAHSVALLRERKRSLITASVTGEFDVTAASSRASHVVMDGVGG